MIEVTGLTRTYRMGDTEVHALRGVDLAIRAGEFVAIMGASGSGKSTLMSILGCLDRPTTGSYRFEGTDVAHLSEDALADIRRQRLGFVFQSFNLLPRTSAMENVGLPLIYGRSAAGGRAERQARARAALARVGLAEREDNTPGQLSGGQQQRVAIARALINAPRLLLADEPTGNLDSKTSHEIMETLTRLNRDNGVTVVVVTHEPDIAAYADRVVTMRDGLVLSDLPNEKRSAPAAATRAPGPPQAAAGGRALGPWAFARMIFAVAVQSLNRNRTRSFLTMLGVFVGVAALITMVAVGQGANDAVKKQIASLGTNLVVVQPGATAAGGARAGAGSASTLTVKDAEAIRAEDPAVESVSYLIRQGGQVIYGDLNWQTSIQGVSPDYPAATNWTIAEGRGLTQADDDAAAAVVLIGQSVYSQLFAPTESPIGARIQVKGTPMEVVGLLTAKGQTGFGQDQDDVVMIPYTTAQRRVLGAAAPSSSQVPIGWIYPTPPNPYGLPPRLLGYVNQIYVQATGAGQVQSAMDEVTATLTRTHRILPDHPNDFSIRNLSQIADAAQGSSQVLALLLAAVASISLVVGGIGIMNILLVSVTARTREIGLRMAIGARRVQVLLQFLAEAVLLSALGGGAGVLMGIAASLILSHFAGWPAPISPVAVVGGFLFSAAIGVFFGYYPAQKAARLDPIEALRYE
ncbi:MAG: ATP-binding cassette domain-containing protein [Rhodobacteraceae bacterium]|nr:ATP-binding cassette domain-containing protein [Paracoccaceae bacterium]